MRRALLLGALALVCAGSAWAASTPESPIFSPSGWTDPQFGPGGSPSCTTTGNVQLPVVGPQPQGVTGTATCTIALTLPETTYSENASVTEQTTGLSGSLTGSCTSSGTGNKQTVFSWSNGTSSPGVVTGTTTENDSCSANMAFTDPQSSTIVMTLSATNTSDFSQADGGPPGTVNGVIVSGTGKFAGLVGTWSQSGSTNGVRLTALRTDSAWHWVAHLHKGAPEVAIAYPRATTTASTDAGLRVVSAPSTSCSATAVSGGKTLKLGSKTTSKTGTALILPKLTAVLQPGAWTVSVACGAASTKQTITVS
jgi:hypothetical protein